MHIRLQPESTHWLRLGKTTRYSVSGDFGRFTTIRKKRNYVFDVIDTSDQVVMTCRPWTASAWAAFMGRKELRIVRADKIIAAVQYYAMGLRTRAILPTGQAPLPRKSARFSLLGTDWSCAGMEIEVSNVDPSIAMGIIGIASFWLIRLDADRSVPADG